MKKHFFTGFFLLLAIVSQVHGQNTLGIDWEYAFGGSQMDFGKKVLCTPQGDYVFLGHGAAANDGDIPTTIAGSNIYLAKFSKEGVKKWAKRYGRQDGPPQYMEVISTPVDFCQTIDAGYLIVATEWSAFDGDSTFVIKIDSAGNQLWRKSYTAVYNPFAIRQRSDGTFLLGAWSGSNEVTVAGLDATGNLSWQRTSSGVANEYAYDLELTKDGGYVIAGSTRTAQTGRLDGFIAKFTSNNQPAWVKRFGINESDDRLFTIEEDNDGNLWAGGDSYAYYDSAQGKLILVPTQSGSNAWLIKTDKDGNALWQKTWAGDHNDRISTLTLTADGNVAVGGVVQSANGEFTPNINGHRLWVARVNKNNGQIMRQGWFGAQVFEDGVEDLIEDPDGSLVFILTTFPNNPYVSNYKGGDYDMWLVKLRNQANSLKTTIYLDNNKNGVHDAGEPPFQQAYIKLKKNADSTLLKYDNSSFTISIDSGRYDVSVVPYRPYYTITPASTQIYFPGYGYADSVWFGVVPVPGVVDLNVSAWSVDRVRMGVNTTIRIQYGNAGTEATNGVLKFVKDHRTNFVSSSLTFTQNGDTLTANVADLKPNESRETFITLAVKIPPEVNWNDTLVHTLSISSAAADMAPVDNRQVIRQAIIAAYDPNDKREITLPGKMNTKQVKDREYLVYQVRFQNVGNDTAFNIVVKDTIEDKLDINTFEMIKADHTYSLQITGNKFVEWRFENILLPDSNVNEPLSHGYIIYRIKAKPGLQVGDIVKNSASIYFDYNLPVKTNEERTSVVPNMPELPSVTGIGSTYCASQGMQKGKIVNLPSDGPGITTTVVKLDNNNITVAADSTFSFNVDVLSAGMHKVEITYSNISGTRTASHQFTVTAAQTPKVTVTASSTVITNLSTPVTLTASSTGSGTNPLYTFARDKAFTNLLQPEGAGTTVQIQPSTLAIGDNKIFVRVKTSATCFTAQNHIDSIVLKRDATTGIIDINNPGFVIKVIPNPFTDRITLRGMDNSKTYSIVLWNSYGQALYRGDVKNRQTFEVPVKHIAPGVYWLTLYDGNKKRIGTEKMIRLK